MTAAALECVLMEMVAGRGLPIRPLDSTLAFISSILWPARLFALLTKSPFLAKRNPTASPTLGSFRSLFSRY